MGARFPPAETVFAACVRFGRLVPVAGVDAEPATRPVPEGGCVGGGASAAGVG